MKKLLSYLKSRTVLTIILIVVLNGLPQLKDYIPADLFLFMNSVLGALAIFFRVNVRQQY